MSSVPTNAPERIKADLVRRIDAGDFDGHLTLPSELSLAAEYGSTRGQIRTVLAALGRRGLIVPRPRSGWAVQARQLSQPMAEMRSFAQWARRSGRVAGGVIRERRWVAADRIEARRIGVRMGDRVLRTVRVRTLDGTPVMVERSVWEPRVAALVAEMPDDIASMTELLAERGFPIVQGDHRIEVAYATTEDAELLGARRASPMLQLSRVSSVVDGTAIEYGVDRYVPGVVAFEIRSAGLFGSPADPQ